MNKFLSGAAGCLLVFVSLPAHAGEVSVTFSTYQTGPVWVSRPCEPVYYVQQPVVVSAPGYYCPPPTVVYQPVPVYTVRPGRPGCGNGYGWSGQGYGFGYSHGYQSHRPSRPYYSHGRPVEWGGNCNRNRLPGGSIHTSKSWRR